MDNSENQLFDTIFNFGGLSIDDESEKLFYEKYSKFKDQIPFDIVKFSRELGINLFTSKGFSDSQSGKIECDPINKNYNIYINANHSINRNIFTLAHEVGHYFCDKDYLEKNEFILEDQSRNNLVEDNDLLKREVRANKFAAEILMPTDKFIEEWQNTKTIEEIAKKFKVFTSAVKVRASNILGIIL